MRVVLEVVIGEKKGLSKTMRSGQQVSVGRSDWADFACTWDDRMSREHFRIQVDDVACKLTDLGSRNGTWVNDQPVKDVLLRSGDQIRCGNTAFRVQIEGDSPELAQTIHDSGYVKAPKNSAVKAALNGKLKGKFRHTIVHSGLNRWTFSAAEISPCALAELLNRLWGLYFIIDVKRAGVTLPPESTAAYLFDFLPAESQKQISPVLISASEDDCWMDFIPEAWGQDALIFLFSPQSHEELLAELRQASQPTRGGGVVGHCWPGVLTSILSSSNADHLPGYVSQLSGVMMESAEDPDQINLYTTQDLSKRLTLFGLKQIRDDVSESTV